MGASISTDVAQAGRELYSPERLFAELIPEVFIRTQGTPRRQAGVLQVFLTDETHPSSWTLDIGRGALVPGLVGAADAMLVIARDDFGALLEGKLDIGRAVGLGRLRFSGNQALLVELARLVRPNTVGY